MRFVAKTNTFPVSVEYPADWSFCERPVPKLVVPRQLFAVSNRPIELTPTNSSQPRPMIAKLDSAAMFVWSYYQAPGDPDPAHPDSLPDYSLYKLPFRYRSSETFQSFDAREWDPGKFLWRRVGFETPKTKLTVWIWEGTTARTDDVSTVEEIVSSVHPLR